MEFEWHWSSVVAIFAVLLLSRILIKKIYQRRRNSQAQYRYSSGAEYQGALARPKVERILPQRPSKREFDTELPPELKAKIDSLKRSIEVTKTFEQMERMRRTLSQDVKNTISDYELQQTRAMNELRLRRTFEERWLSTRKELENERQKHQQTRRSLIRLRRRGLQKWRNKAI